MSAEAIDASVESSDCECPRCGLRVVQRFRRYAIRHCPRCVARYRAAVELLPRPLAPDAGVPVLSTTLERTDPRR
jgi:hypothetical protein